MCNNKITHSSKLIISLHGVTIKGIVTGFCVFNSLSIESWSSFDKSVYSAVFSVFSPGIAWRLCQLLINFVFYNCFWRSSLTAIPAPDTPFISQVSFAERKISRKKKEFFHCNKRHLTKKYLYTGLLLLLLLYYCIVHQQTIRNCSSSDCDSDYASKRMFNGCWW